MSTTSPNLLPATALSVPVPQQGQPSLTFSFGVIRMHHFVLSAFLSVALCFCLGCDRDRFNAPGNQCLCGVTNWLRISAEPSGFSAFMPTQPTHSVVTNETVAGPLVISILTSEISPTVAFSIVRNSFPTNIVMTNTAKLFAGGLKQALGADGRLTAGHDISLNGYMGREWRFEKYRGQAVITMRVYLVGHHLYQAVCVMPKGRVCQRHVAEFLESCELRSK
jgi:hypothetical protein